MKHLTITLLTLLVLGGCTSELDRCIEVNTGTLENNLTEKWQTLMEEHLDENNDLPDGGYSDIENDFLENVLTDFEREVDDCSRLEYDGSENPMVVPDPFYAYVFEETFREEFSSQYKERRESCAKSLLPLRVEKATKICNSQGIY